MTGQASTLERLGTGSAALDVILGGGIPAGSVTVVAGEPGSGKTVFTLQTLFHHARQGKKCVYFTTLSEPAMKVIRYLQLFSFFEARLIEVLKLRGANDVTGRHFFEIGGEGLAFYPRVGGPELDREPLVDLSDRVATGVAGLDALLLGGVPRASATIVEGGTGTGKSL